jgi:hypothetical protein
MTSTSGPTVKHKANINFFAASADITNIFESHFVVQLNPQPS